MGLFKQIAEPLITKNVPVIPLRPKTKIAFLSNWPDAATTDITQVDKWDEEYPGANGACVALAKPEGVLFFEIDKPGFLETIEQQTGQKMPETMMVRSRPGRGHFYFKHTPLSLELARRDDVIKGRGDDGKETFSARINNAYVVAPGSTHPDTGLLYETLRDIDIAPVPDWLMQWCIANRATAVKTGNPEFDDDTPIAEGSRNSALASILGRARQVLAMDRDQLYDYGRSVNQRRCVPPLLDSEVRTIAYSIGRYEVKQATPVIMGGVPLGQPAQAQQIAVPVAVKAIPYPVFPRWVMKGTSIYDGMIAPVCAVNSRYPEFMFMPAVVLVLNYVATKVRIEYKNITPSFYMVSIGRKGRVIKSSSVKDAVEYLHAAGIVDDAGPHSRNAEGKSLVFTAGSPEGLGMEMSRTNCKNAVLFYDELSSLTNKAGIEGSSLGPKLLEMYESSKFSNVVKSRKEQYNLEAGTYCTSLIACTTEKNFSIHWSKMAAGSSGLDERFFFLYQPEVLAKLKPYTWVDTKPAAVETRKRIDIAVKRGVYHITDTTPLEEKIGKLGNRTEIRAEKLALYFAIDLGRDEIDEDCIDRAIAICEYELAVKRYLRTFEAVTREGAVQNEIIQALQRNGGSIEKRELDRIVHPLRHGTSLYNQCYVGLYKSGYIAEQGTGVKNDPFTVVLMRNVDEDEDD